MRFRRLAVVICLQLLTLTLPALATSFVLFPKAGRLVSPDGRFEIRDADRPGAASDFVGAFHSLWVIDLANWRSRKVCDYMGSAAVGWSGSEYLLVTEYVGKKTSRALVFPMGATGDPLLIDTAVLERALASEFREVLRNSDHVFVEASSLEKGVFYFRTWGYGSYDKSGFRWKCEYAVVEEKLTCSVSR